MKKETEGAFDYFKDELLSATVICRDGVSKESGSLHVCKLNGVKKGDILHNSATGENMLIESARGRMIWVYRGYYSNAGPVVKGQELINLGAAFVESEGVKK